MWSRGIELSNGPIKYSIAPVNTQNITKILKQKVKETITVSLSGYNYYSTMDDKLYQTPNLYWK